MIDFKVLPLNVSQDEMEAYNKAINIFNSIQNQYCLKPSDKYNFSNEKLLEWPDIRDSLNRSFSEDRVISVTSIKFSDNWFSHTEDNISVISTADWKDVFSPPGLHCYLLLEFALSVYFHASDISEAHANPHVETIGCMLDMCSNKLDNKWKLKAGYICSNHSADFLKFGGNEEQIEALQKVLDEIRRITLGKPRTSNNQVGEIEKNNSKAEFSLDYIKKSPVVVAAIIMAAGLSLGWGTAYKVWVDPSNAEIKKLETEAKKYKVELKNYLSK